MSNKPSTVNNQQLTILALDFDGVICDGLIEYFATTKKTYQQIWHDDQISDDLALSFYKLRPVIETGWEMPILLRALVLGIAETEIFTDWSAIAGKIIESEQLNKQELARTLDQVRDHWIHSDLDGWLKLHRFYPGVIERLQQIINSAVELYIVTTKEGRFVNKLLQERGVDLPAEKIIGKESKRPKYETLRIIRDKTNTAGANFSIYFVEDRLPALQQVAQQADLHFVKLFLADWGYNTERDRNFTKDSQQIQLLSLEEFRQDFTAS
jgi:phosphoglycolate phosphatase-like HAD superfamily hydrolase